MSFENPSDASLSAVETAGESAEQPSPQMESRLDFEREKIEPALHEAEHLAAVAKNYIANRKHINKRIANYLEETAQILSGRIGSLHALEERLERRQHNESFQQAERLFGFGYRVLPIEGHRVEFPVGSGNFDFNDGWEGFGLYDKDRSTVLAEWSDNQSEEAQEAGDMLALVPVQKWEIKDNPYSVLMYLLELSEEAVY